MEEERFADSPAQGTGVVHTISEFNTKYNADCVEWCPIAEYTNYFVYGTYQLEENENQEQKWLGNVVLNQLSSNNSENLYSLEKMSDIKINGVFDVKWSPRLIQDKCVLAVASCDGFVQLLQVNFNSPEKEITEVNCTNISETQTRKPLSVDWNSWKYESSSTNLIVSDSLGHLSYLFLKEDGIHVEQTWKAHNFEAWTASFDYDQPCIVYSGGDDCHLKVWDLRANTAFPTNVLKNHSMGVTTITKSKKNEFFLASGSYDEHVFLWDLRKLKDPMSEERICGGGIWKLKWHPTLPHYLLVAAMHQGFHILHLEETGSFTRETSYEKHKSLAYGTDWCYKTDWSTNKMVNSNSNRYIVASCSFYDNLVHLWETKLKYV